MTMQLLCAFTIAFLFVTAFGKWYIPWLEKDPIFFELGNWILRQSMKDTLEIVPVSVRSHRPPG